MENEEKDEDDDDDDGDDDDDDEMNDNDDFGDDDDENGQIKNFIFSSVHLILQRMRIWTRMKVFGSPLSVGQKETLSVKPMLTRKEKESLNPYHPVKDRVLKKSKQREKNN